MKILALIFLSFFLCLYSITFMMLCNDYSATPFILILGLAALLGASGLPDKAISIILRKKIPVIETKQNKTILIK